MTPKEIHLMIQRIQTLPPHQLIRVVEAATNEILKRAIILLERDYNAKRTP